MKEWEMKMKQNYNVQDDSYLNLNDITGEILEKDAEIDVKDRKQLELDLNKKVKATYWMFLAAFGIGVLIGAWLW